jgi:hypothetical protein
LTSELCHYFLELAVCAYAVGNTLYSDQQPEDALFSSLHFAFPLELEISLVQHVFLASVVGLDQLLIYA